MNAEEIIASGRLEMYVCGSLPQEEVLEIEAAIADNPELLKEIELIEASLIKLAQTVAPSLPAMVWTYVLNSIRKVKELGQTKPTSVNWPAISGWAAAILFMGGIMWMMKQNNDLNILVNEQTIKSITLQEKVINTENELAENNDILEIIRSKEYQAITLPGNEAVAPEAFAKVYLNKSESVAYIDITGLPEPPAGKVYQVWSLIMEPLTPTSMGLIATQNEAGKGIYKFESFPAAQAFGITLEPEGGSESPTLSQLYTLGMVTI